MRLNINCSHKLAPTSIIQFLTGLYPNIAASKNKIPVFQPSLWFFLNNVSHLKIILKAPTYRCTNLFIILLGLHQVPSRSSLFRKALSLNTSLWDTIELEIRGLSFRPRYIPLSLNDCWQVT